MGTHIFDIMEAHTFDIMRAHTFAIMRKGTFDVMIANTFEGRLDLANTLEIMIAQTLTLSQTSPGFYVSAAQVFRKHCGKRRNCL